MATLEEIQQILTRIEADLPALIQRSQISPKQVVIVNGLSDLSERLGLVQAGEFRSGNGLEPGFGFSGTRMGYPPFSYSGELWNIVGIENDVIQVGIRASDGKLLFGGGNGFLDQFGVNLKNQLGAINFQDSISETYDNVLIYIDGGDSIVLSNGAGNTSSGVRFDIDTPGNTDVVQYKFEYDHATFPANVTVVGTLTVQDTPVLGTQPMTNGWFPLSHTWTRTGDHSFTVPGDETSLYRKGTKVAYTEDENNSYGIVASSSYDGVGDLTTVNLIPNDDYVLGVGGVLADPQVGYVENPLGFPDEFNFTITGAAGASTMTSTISSTTNAVWRPAGAGWVEVTVHYTTTTGGTADSQLNIDPPVDIADGNSYALSAAYTDGFSPPRVGTGVANGTSNTLMLRRPDGANFGLGANRVVQLHGTYPY
jgi:hypothetical protein